MKATGLTGAERIKRALEREEEERKKEAKRAAKVAAALLAMTLLAKGGEKQNGKETDS